MFSLTVGLSESVCYRNPIKRNPYPVLGRRWSEGLRISPSHAVKLYAVNRSVGIAALRSNRSVGIVEDIFSTDRIFSCAVIFICVVLLVDIIVCSLCSAPGCRRIGEEAVE